ncbi:MAG: HigA family addiction module antitoxin [Desulfobacterales bacterium]
MGVPAQRISEIVAGKRSITADTDLRLCRFFGLSNGYWLRAQVAHDTEVAEKTLSPLLKRSNRILNTQLNNADRHYHHSSQRKYHNTAVLIVYEGACRKNFIK